MNERIIYPLRGKMKVKTKIGETHEKLFGHLSKTPDRTAIKPTIRIKYKQNRDQMYNVLLDRYTRPKDYEGRTGKVNYVTNKTLCKCVRKILNEREYTCNQ